MTVLAIWCLVGKYVVEASCVLKNLLNRNIGTNDVENDVKRTLRRYIPSYKARGKSLQHLAYEISHFSKGFLAETYEISDF